MLKNTTLAPNEQSCVYVAYKARLWQRGATLVELLFAFAFLSFTLAGSTALLLTSNEQHKHTLYSQYAMLVAEEIATRMRVHRRLVGNVDIYLQHNWETTPQHRNCTQHECSFAKFAAFEIAQLQTMTMETIPTGRVDVTRCGALICATVYWSAADMTLACTQNHCIRLRFF